MATRVGSYSKINLGLAIGPVRADGFHGLTTLYQTLALHDVVTVEARGTGNREQGTADTCGPMSQSRDMGPPTPGESRISLTTNHAQVPADERNTAWRMVARAARRMAA